MLPPELQGRVPINLKYEFFIRLLRASLGGKKWHGLHPAEIPAIVRLGLKEGNLNEESLVSKIPQLKIPALTETNLPKGLTPKRAEEVMTIAKWVMPAIALGGRRPLCYNIIVTADEGQGKTYFAEAITELLTMNTPDGSVRQVFPEQGAIDAVNFTPGTVLVMDGVEFIRPGRKLSPNLTNIIIINKHDFDYALDIVTGVAYTMHLEDLDTNDIIDIGMRSGLIDTKIDPALDHHIEFMIEKGITPKEILVSLALARRIVATTAKPEPIDSEVLYMTAEKLGAPRKVSVPLDKLESYLTERVYGQQECIKLISRHLSKSHYGLSENNRPLLVAAFFGPTGVGKTEMAKQISNAYFGDDSLIRIDMSEMSEGHAVANLFGSPAGYIGYGEDSVLVSKLKEKKNAVILFDEIEKASMRVRNALLNMLDEGKFTTTKGDEMNLKGCIIIMTSNAAVKELASGKTGFHTEEEKNYSQKDVREILKRNQFAPEFLNRIDIVATFDKLSEEAVHSIIEREMKKTKAALLAKGIKLTYDKEIFKKIHSKYNSNDGGRAVIREIEQVRSNIVEDLARGKNVKEIKARY